MKIKNQSASSRTTHPCIPSQKPPPLDHSSTFRFMHLLIYIFTHFAGHHPTRLLLTAAHTPASTPLFACQKLFPCLPALANAEELIFLFCLWSRRPAAPLNPLPGATAPDKRSFLTPAMSSYLCYHVKKCFLIISSSVTCEPRTRDLN